MKTYFKTILCGVGQVMLQNNALTGLVFLIGIFYNSWIFGIGALLGNIVSNFFAKRFKYSKIDIEDGLYGFNGTLVGIAIFYFLGINFISFLAIIAGVFLSTIIMHFISKKFPAFTSPFVFATWIIIFIITYFNLTSIVTFQINEANSLNLLSSFGNNFSQVMFQQNIITGILFLIGILINSRISAFYALYGSIIGSLLALLISSSTNMLNAGLFGYNAVLCAIALGNNKKKNTFIFTTIGIILSVFITLYFDKNNIIALTAPFVFATWIVLILRKIKK